MKLAATWKTVPYEGRSPFKRMRIRDDARIQTVLRHIADRNYVAVLGPPLSEKSQLLHDIAAAAEATGLFHTTYIDLWQARSEDMPAFFASIMRLISRPHGIRFAPGLDRATNARSFANFLMNCADHQDRDIVLVIDHLHALPSDLVHSLLLALRTAYMERDPLAHRHLEAVVTGSTNLAGLATGPTSPFNMARRVWITPLDRDQSKALVEATLGTYGFEASEGALERILEWAAGDYWFLPLLCEWSVEAAHEYRKRIIRVPAVDRAIQRMWATDEAQAPIRNAIHIIEEDPDTLLDVTQLLDRRQLHQRQARQAITRSGIDRLRLSGAVILDAGYYKIKNLTYHRALSEELTDAEVGRVLRMSGRWREAIDYLSPRLTKDAPASGRADLLDAIVQSIYAADRLEDACHALVEGIKRGFLLTDVHVYRADAAHGKLRLVCPSSPSTQLQSDIEFGDPECAEAQAYRSGDYAIRFGAEAGRLVAALVPEHRPIGVVTIERYVPDVAPYTDDGVRHKLPPNLTELLRFLRHAATAIDGVMLRSAYQEIGRAVLDVRAVHPMFDRVLTSVANAAGCDYAVLHLLDASGTWLEASAGIGHDWRPEWRGTLRVSMDGSHLIARCLQIDQLLIARGTDPQLTTPTSEYQVLFPYLRVFCPLSAGGTRLGTLEVGYQGRTKRIVTEDDRHMLTVFADQVAIAVYNAQLLRRTDEALARRVAEMEKIREISLTVSATLNLQKVLAHIIQSLRALFPHTEITIWQYQPESKTLTVLQSSIADPDYLAQRLDLAGLTGRALEQRAVQTTMDIEACTDSAIHNYAARLGFCSMMVLPLTSLDRVLGAIHIYTTADDCYALTEQESLTGFATQAAIAIDNAQRYQALEDAKRELEDTRERELFDLAKALLHRIGNVVGDVPFQLEKITERAAIGDEIASPVAHIRQRVSSLRNLGESLKTLVDLPDMLNQRVDLRQAIHRAIEQATACQHVEVFISAPVTPVWVTGDPQLLADAIQSLIENACEAMEGNGKIEINLGWRADDWVELQVQDTGPGIPVENHSRLFEPGYSTKSTPGRERGRGLFSSAAIIRKHRGKVKFDSRLGHGTTFIIALPVLEDQTLSPELRLDDEAAPGSALID